MNKRFFGRKSDVKKALSAYGLSDVFIEKIREGIINSSFLITDQLGKRYVLRVYQKELRSDFDILQEIRTVRLFGKSGIPVPCYYNNLQGTILTKFTDSNQHKWQAILIEFLPGRHLQPSDFSLIPEFARIQSNMHMAGKKVKSKKEIWQSFAKIINWLRYEEDRASKKLSLYGDILLKYNNIVQDILSEAERQKDEIVSLPVGLVHLDYDSDNILVSDGHICGVLDFDDLSCQPMILDSAFSLWWWLFSNPRTESKKILKKYFYEYGKCRRLSVVEMRLFSLFLRLRNAILGGLLFVNLPSKVDLKSLKKSIRSDGEFGGLKL